MSATIGAFRLLGAGWLVRACGGCKAHFAEPVDLDVRDRAKCPSCNPTSKGRPVYFGPNYRIRDGRAHHVNETPGDPGAPAELGDDGAWRLARSER